MSISVAADPNRLRPPGEVIPQRTTRPGFSRIVNPPMIGSLTPQASEPEDPRAEVQPPDSGPQPDGPPTTPGVRPVGLFRIVE